MNEPYGCDCDKSPIHRTPLRSRATLSPGGHILATYTREELTLSITLALEQMSADLEARLEWWLDMLAASTGCDDAQAERLLAHWETVNAKYTATVTALAAVRQSVNSENPALNDRTATSTTDTTTCMNGAV
jgi:hypothetical protein